jgi:23S rRNA U2552 (ribose-2'-O)-methylase RlmE/FtsJ
MTIKFHLNLDDLLNRKALHIKIPPKIQAETISNYPINYIDSHVIKKHNFNILLYKIISKYKEFIDIPEIRRKWNKLKLFTNPFELVSYNNSYKDIQSLIDYIPLSRAYFKLQELIVEYDLINKISDNIKYAGLAEGPGGFVECFINYRRSLFSNTHDDIYCITLRETDDNDNGNDNKNSVNNKDNDNSENKNNENKDSDNKDNEDDITIDLYQTPQHVTNIVPDWDKIEVFLGSKHNLKANVNLSYGCDGTGNLYNIDNILHFRDSILGNGTNMEREMNKVDFVTGDGGLDYSVNFNYQEQLSFRLIFCEIVSAFSILKTGGNFVLKIFDIHTTITLQYIYLLANYFEEVIINKPYTSRPANSEKYLVCKNFRGVSDGFMNKLYEIVRKWEITKNNGRYIDNLFGKVPPYFKKNILNFSKYIGEIQIENILFTIMCRSMNKQQIDSLLRSKISHTLYWAIKYKQPINYKSTYFKSFKS